MNAIRSTLSLLVSLNFYCGCISCLGLVSLISSKSFADPVVERLQQQESSVKNLKISLLVQAGDTTLHSYRATELFTPASVQKLFTTSAVLKELGPHAVFKTDFYYQADQRALIVVPSADPTLTGDELLNVLRVLESNGVTEIKKVLLVKGPDDSDIPARGKRAYESGAGPLSFNFNALGIRICPAKPGEPAKITTYSGLGSQVLKNQVKTVSNSTLTDVNAEEGDGSSWRVSGQIAANSECYELYRSTADPTKYFLNELTQLGRAFSLRFSANQVEAVASIPGNSRQVYTIRSKEIGDLLASMNHLSSNFFAEQFVIALGKKLSGDFSYAHGIERVIQAAGSTSIVADGSGLSRSNRTTVTDLLRVFRDLIGRQDLRVAFENSLPEYGLSGTLKERTGGLGQCFVRAKTGTLDGVNALVGMLYRSSDAAVPEYFALLQNGTTSIPEGRQFEDVVLKMLCQDNLIVPDTAIQ